MQNTAIGAPSFVGRAREINEINALLDDPACRLITLVGPGGIGKTRLALQIATLQREAFYDHVYFVPLTTLTSSADILAAIAKAMTFGFQHDRDPDEQLLAFLREKQDKRILLVLDNFEHLLGGVDIISEILSITNATKFIVTSREALNLQEEWLRQISGLSYPDQADGVRLEDYGAVQLFLERARQAGLDLDLAEYGDSVVEICRLVDGGPLAIELAAGWLKTLQPPAIAQEIKRNLDFLATRSRNLPGRHRSIREVFRHSWRLLLPVECEVFQKLSVFRGGFTRDAAEAIANASLPLLAGLIDKSLLRLRRADRYDIHELLRQYGAEQLAEAGATEQAQRAYSAYYLDLLRRIEPDIKGAQQIAALDLIVADFENIREAWRLAALEGNIVALNMAVESLQLFADMRGHYHEVATLLRLAVERLPQATDPEQIYMLRRIQARLLRLILLGNMAVEPDLGAQVAACLASARAKDDKAEIGFCLLLAGIYAFSAKDATPAFTRAEADPLFHKGAVVFDALDDTFYRAEALAWSACAPVHSDGPDISLEYLQQSLALRRSIGDRNGIAWIMLNLIEVAAERHNYADCERYAREALALMREIRSLKGISQAMFKLAQTVLLRGDLDQARALAEELAQLSYESNNMDGRMSSMSLLAILTSLLDEDYTEAAALAAQMHALALQPFFIGHDYLAADWGQAIAACGLGHYDAARQSYARLFWHGFNDPAPATVCLALEAVALAHEDAPEQAVALLGLAFHQPDYAGGWLHRWPLLVRLRADLINHLGLETYQAAWDRGCHYDLQATISSIIGELNSAPHAISGAHAAHNAEPQQAANQALIEPLSERELEVLQLIAAGLSNRDIAERLTLTVGTVKTHTRNIYGKLNVSSRTQALAEAARQRIL